MSLDTNSNTHTRVLEDGVILCIRLDDGSRALEICRAAAAGGLRTLEITLTTPGALDVIRELAGDQDLLVGAGTALSADDVRAVHKAGGRFVMSPTFDPEVLDQARKLGVLAVPGASTPTEILAAHRYGASLVKVFPAGALGGPEYLRRVRGPLPAISLVPTSGPTAETIADYLAAGAVAVGIGPEVVGEDRAPQEITDAAARVRAALDEARAAAR
ncbi:MAG: bifunctional 4-hydroxy-2-oxoglutarate aldolase/2-dehydro-3-deoxy-phosphogluconate aldolase [Planctomycetota bacterium]